MNPCRFRFNKTDTMLDGSKTADDITQFLSWSTQGGDHQDVRAYGKCILVNDKPATVAEGLKLAYPDLDKRTVLVQTGDGFAVFDHGKQYKQSYLEKAVTELAATRATAASLINCRRVKLRLRRRLRSMPSRSSRNLASLKPSPPICKANSRSPRTR